MTSMTNAMAYHSGLSPRDSGFFNWVHEQRNGAVLNSIRYRITNPADKRRSWMRLAWGYSWKICTSRALKSVSSREAVAAIRGVSMLRICPASLKR